MRWRRELVRRKWTYQRDSMGGRPRIDREIEDLILRLAQKNPCWGYSKIKSKLIKLDFMVSQTTIRNILNRHNLQPPSVRNGSIFWRQLMAHYKDQILACDFCTVESIRL